MSPWMHVAGWTLIHFVWQGAVVAVAAAVFLQLCRNRAASVRYAIACGALVTMLAGVLVTAMFIDLPADPRGMAGPALHTPSSVRTDVLLPINVGPDSPPAFAPAWTVRVEPLLPWIVGIWLCGVLLLLARVGAGWWQVHRLHQCAAALLCSHWQETGNRIAARLGLARFVRIVELPHAGIPMVVGCLRPIVVLPIAALSTLNAAQVEAIIAHELAHVRRHDYLVNLMQTLAETLLFYHPAVWWLSTRIREEREHCCDDVAVAVCGDPVEYAAALAELDEWKTEELELAAAATGGSLLIRVRRILRVEVSDARMSPWAFGIGVVAIAGGSVLTALAQAPAQSETQPSFEVASVRPNVSGDTKMSNMTFAGGRYHAINIPLRLLIMHSYGLQPQQLVDAPDWISSERFDVVAKADGELDPPVSRDTPSRLHLMIRSLLAERFKLRAHREPRQIDIYALVRARPDGRLGPELKPSAVDCEALRAARRGGGPPPEPTKPGERPQCGARVGAGELIAGGQPLLELVSLLSGTVGRSVIDRTGLNGTYDIYLKWTPDFVRQRPPGSTPGETIRINGVEFDPSGPSIFTALQEQLGLKLESERGIVEALVIDHIERPVPD